MGKLVENRLRTAENAQSDTSFLLILVQNLLSIMIDDDVDTRRFQGSSGFYSPTCLIIFKSFFFLITSASYFSWTRAERGTRKALRYQGGCPCVSLLFISGRFLDMMERTENRKVPGKNSSDLKEWSEATDNCFHFTRFNIRLSCLLFGLSLPFFNVQEDKNIRYDTLKDQGYRTVHKVI
jgi:hypothetical protein